MARTDAPGMKLSSYAFNNYGNDAALYNGIADLESVSKALADALLGLYDEFKRGDSDMLIDRCDAAAHALAAYREHAALASSEVKEGW